MSKLKKQNLKSLRETRRMLTKILVKTMNGEITITKCDALNRTCENIIESHKEERRLNQL